MHQENGHKDLFLYYWISICPIGQDPDNDEDDNKKLSEEEILEKQRMRKIASKIKNSFNLRDIYNTKNPLKNDQVYEKYKQKEQYCPTLTHDFMEIYYSEWEEQGHNVIILFYRITEKWRLCKVELDIPEDKSLLTAIHRDITFRNNLVDDWDNDFNEILEQLTSKLEEKKFYNLKELQTDKIKTNLYSYQLNNVNHMVESENNPQMELISDDQMFFYKDGTRVYNYYRDEDTTYDALEKTKVKGKIIMDQVGIGKTLQALALINEQNYNRTLNGLPKFKTLAIVPNHLKDHWNDEIRKHIVDFDTEFTQIVTFESFLKMSIKEGDYDRVIVDEIHELYSKEENQGIFDKITELKFTYKHGLTGTPFPCENSIFNLLIFLTDVDYSLENMERFEYHYPVYEKIFLKNTLDNIDAEISLPPLEEQIYFLDFNRQEKILYESEMEAKTDADEMFLRKLCCDVMINFKNKNIRILTLEDFINVVLNDYRNKYEVEQAICDELTEIIESIIEEIKELKGEENETLELNRLKITHLEDNKLIYTKKLSRQSEIRNNKKKSYDFLEAQINSTKECPVCLDEIEDTDEYSMLPCGHIFCVDCYEVVLAEKSKCDVCHKKIDKGQITKISKYSEKKMNYGTKINRLIILANDLAEKKRNGEIDSDKLIIYSQFPEMLEELVEILNSEGISSLIYNDQFDIKRFREDENLKCFVISSNKNAAGMDLSFVNNILIYEPIKGDKSYLRDVERQIIGRIRRINQTKPSNVYKFIINDTIEKQIYNELSA